MLAGVLTTLLLMLCPGMARADSPVPASEGTSLVARETTPAEGTRADGGGDDGTPAQPSSALLPTGDELYGPIAMTLSTTTIVSAGLAVAFAVKYRQSNGDRRGE